MKKVILVGVSRIPATNNELLASIQRFRSWVANTLEDSMPFGEVDVRDVEDARSALDEVRKDPAKATVVFFEHDPVNDYPRLVKDSLADMGRNDQVIVVRDRMPLHRVHEIEVPWFATTPLQKFIAI